MCSPHFIHLFILTKLNLLSYFDDHQSQLNHLSLFSSFFSFVGKPLAITLVDEKIEKKISLIIGNFGIHFKIW